MALVVLGLTLSTTAIPNPSSSSSSSSSTVVLNCSSAKFNRDLYLLGPGICANAANATPNAYVCTGAQCPALGDPQACGLICDQDVSCTGFQVGDLEEDEKNGANEQNHGYPVCKVFTNVKPTVGPSEWVWTRVNGTQPPGNISIARALTTKNASASASGSTSTSCCFKRAYPRPNPVDNPVPKPVQQTERAMKIFANRSAMAAKASIAALPKVTHLVDVCANLTKLFTPQNCPGLADLTDNGTLAPWPSAAQILERFSAEVSLVVLLWLGVCFVCPNEL